MSRRSLDLFVESSALVAWVVWEKRGREVVTLLRRARTHWLSALAPAEAQRALRRALAAGLIDLRYAADMRRRVDGFAAACRSVPVDTDILERCGRVFAAEPVRTLDAIHLASLERVRLAVRDITLLSLDDRVRHNASLMGVAVVPP
jgi:uncharacterized protein with PIN domain